MPSSDDHYDHYYNLKSLASDPQFMPRNRDSMRAGAEALAEVERLRGLLHQVRNLCGATDREAVIGAILDLIIDFDAP